MRSRTSSSGAGERRFTRPAFSAFAALAVLAASLTVVATDGPAARAEEPAGTVYYVSADGSDLNDGTALDAPLRSIGAVNALDLQPGDRVLFKRGDAWHLTAEEGTLAPQGNGTADAYIAIGSYGVASDPAPLLAGDDQVSDVIRLNNQQYWSIGDLEITNTAAGYDGRRVDDSGALLAVAQRQATGGGLLKDRRGIHIIGSNNESTDKKILRGFRLHDLNIHDVTGVVFWISGLNDTNTTTWSEPGVMLGTGWDNSKRTGAILMETRGGTGPTIFRDVLVENNDLRHNSFGGFTIKQWNGGASGPHWAFRPTAINPPQYAGGTFVPHENITVRGNYVDQTGDYNANGIYVTSAKDVLIENNVVKNPGVSGIEVYYVDTAIVQHNEVFGSTPKAGGADSNGIDPDRQSTNVIVQYNYIHDNGDGILVCGFDYNSVVIRYNVLKDNTGTWIRDAVGGGRVDVYNNIFYNTINQLSLRITNAASQNDSWAVRNNIVYNTNAAVASATYGTANAKVVWGRNAFYGPGVTPNGAGAITTNPGFVDPAPELGTGTSVADRVRDFSAFVPQEGSPLRQIPGIKFDATVGSAAGNAYTLAPNGLDYAGTAATTPTIGLYETPMQSADAVVVAGTVRNADGQAVSGAKLTLTKSGAVDAETTAAADGSFSFPARQGGDGYALRVTHPEYRNAVVDPLLVYPGQADALAITLTSIIDGPQVPISEDFQSLPLGAFAGDAVWGVYRSSDTDAVEVIADPADANNRVLRLSRGSGSAGLAVFNRAPANLTGQFVIEAKIRRTTTTGQYAIYSYDQDTFNATTPPSSTGVEATITMSGSNIGTHATRGSSTQKSAQSYSANTWYNVRSEVDWNVGTFDMYVNGVLRVDNGAIRTWAATANLDHINIFATDGSGDFLVDDLRVGAVLDTTALSAAVAAAESLDSAKYTQESWETLASALTDAQTQLNRWPSTQTAVDHATARLTEAHNGLVPAAAALDITIATDARCVASKVVLTATLRNNDAVPVTATIATAYGQTTVPNLAPGKSVSRLFSTRIPVVAATSATATIVSANDPSVRTVQTIEFPARSC